jgi:hypothetical protein
LPTHLIDPNPDQDPADALIQAIDRLEKSGEVIGQILVIDQPIPRKSHWLIVTTRGRETRG